MVSELAQAGKDHPGVIAPPPLLALAVVVLGLLLDWLLPAYLLGLLLALWLRVFLAVMLIGGGGLLAALAIREFRAAGTHVEPWKPSTALVAGSVYAYSRNPIYAGLTMILTGLAFAFASDWMLVLVIVAFVPAMHYGVIKREERYLAAKFGEPYRRYMDAVPRYGPRI